MKFLRRLRFFRLRPAVQFLATALLSAGTTAGVALTRLPLWQGIWHQTGQELAESMALLAPLAGFFAALAAQRFRRSGLEELSNCASQPRILILARVIARPYGAMIAGFGVVAAPAYGWTAYLARAGTFSPAQLASILGLLAVATLLGFSLGSKIRHPIAPLGVFILVLLGHNQLVISATNSLANLTIGDATGDIFLYRPASYYLLQVGVYLGLSLGLLLLLAKIRTLSALPLSFAVGCAIALLALGENTYKPVPTAESLRCTGTDIEICLPKILSFQEPRLRRETAAVLRVTQVLHPQGVQLRSGQESVAKSDTGKLLVPLLLPARYYDISARFDRDQIMHRLIPTLLGGQGCALSSAGPELSLTGEVLLWLLRTENAVPSDQTLWSALPYNYRSTGLAEALVQASPERQRAWLLRNRESLASCGAPVGGNP